MQCYGNNYQDGLSNWVNVLLKHKASSSWTIWFIITIGIAFFLIAILIILMPQNIQAKGFIVPCEYQSVYARGSGKIDEVFVSDGQFVKKGTIICTLDRIDEQRRYNEMKSMIELLKEKKQLFNGQDSLRHQRFKNKDNYNYEIYNSTRKKFELGVASKQEVDETYMILKDEQNAYFLQNNYSDLETIESEEKIKHLIIEINQLASIIENQSIFAGSDGTFLFHKRMYDNDRFMTQLEPEFKKGKVLNQGDFIGYILTDRKSLVQIQVAEKHIKQVKKDAICTIRLIDNNFFNYSLLYGNISSISPLALRGYCTVTVTINDEVAEKISYKTGLSADVYIRVQKNIFTLFTGGA